MSDGPIVDKVDIGTAFDLLTGRSKPMATCPADDEPLVFTLEFRGAEFICVVCGTKYGFLSPKAAAVTPALEARLAELQERYEQERVARSDAGGRDGG